MTTSVICDMDGVLYRGRALIEGALEFVNRLIQEQTGFLFLTNNSEQTPVDLRRKLEQLGIRGVTEVNFITSAMATAMFVRQQNQGSTAFDRALWLEAIRRAPAVKQDFYTVLSARGCLSEVEDFLAQDIRLKSCFK